MPAKIPCPVTADELRELYKQMPSDKLAEFINKRFGLSITKSWVIRRLKEFNIPMRQFSPYKAKRIECPFSKDRLYELYWKEGLCCREILEIAGINASDAVAQRWLREAGIKTRTPHEWLTLRTAKDPERWKAHGKMLAELRVITITPCKLTKAAIRKGVKKAAELKRAKRETRACAYCGKPVTRPPSEFKAPPERTHCSVICARKNQKYLHLERLEREAAEKLVTEIKSEMETI